MLSVSNLSLQFGKRILFDEVNITFSPGNCYGIIGANGAGKSTFLKILSKDLEPNTGSVFLEPGKRLSVLEQNHNRYDDKTVIETVILGNQKLFDLKSEIDSIYAKEDFSDKDADRVGELQASFEEMNGWNADADAAFLLSSLGISEEIHNISMNDIDQKVKVKVLLAQCLFGNPDVLIMDEPTNDLDYTTVEWLVNFINEFLCKGGNFLVKNFQGEDTEKLFKHIKSLFNKCSYVKPEASDKSSKEIYILGLEKK